ncbi:ABC transporter ATP-binding protein [Blastococcus sp. KM273129]|nr:ABC transporter ATP-binding protein [Blastococcus sp. KM273129]
MRRHGAPPGPRGLRPVLPFVRPERGRLALAAGASIGQVGCSLLRPWPLALAVDSALGGLPPQGPAAPLAGVDPVGLLVVAAVATVALVVAEGLLGVAATASSERAAERIGGRLRAGVFAHVLTLSLRWHDRTRSGEVANRLTTDVGRALDAVVVTFTTLVPDLLLLTGVLVVLLAVDPVLALLGTTVLPVLAWLTARQRRRVRAAEQAARAASGRLAATAVELLRNVRAVQAFGRLDRAQAMFAAHNDSTVAAEQAVVTTEARWSPVPSVVLAFGTGAVLLAGGLQVRDGVLTTGELLVVLAYLRDLQSPVRGLVRLTGVRAKAAASIARLAEVLDCTEAVPAPARPHPVPPVREGLRLEGVRFAYAPDRPVLDGFDLTVAAGETVCLFGPSGSGKSTVLQLVLRLYDVDGGRILLDGIDLRGFDPVQLRQSLAYVPQDPWLLDGTLAENIAFGNPAATREELVAAAQAARVEEFAARLPLGYDTPLGESGAQLSGGQRRRVALARAVISPAPVLLLDEPTASLDREAAHQVIAAIRTVGRGRTVLVVTHDPRLAAIADRTVEVQPPAGPLPAPPPVVAARPVAARPVPAHSARGGATPRPPVAPAPTAPAGCAPATGPGRTPARAGRPSQGERR